MTTATPPPLPDQLSSRARYSMEFRSAIDSEAANDEANSPSSSTLWQSVGGHVLNTSFRYTTWTHPISDFKWDLHDLWYTLIQAAQIMPADDAAQDRLVHQVLYARSLGTLRRTTTGTEEQAITADGGRIWTNLPYLVCDLQTVWEQSTALSPTHRHNLAAFTARLAALGVGGADLSDAALWLLRTALETPRPLTKAGGGDSISLAELLPACVAWFQYCNHRLLTLSVSQHGSHAPAATPGELAQIAQVSHWGFSVARWLFWRRRFKELSRCTDDDVVARQGKRGFGLMVKTGRDLGYQIPGEANYVAKVQQALLDELKRSGKQYVTSDEIVIDLDWAD